MSRIEEKLSALGESLPEAKKPVANYLGCKRSGNTLYVSGRVSQIRGEAIHCLLDTMYAGRPYTVVSHAVHIHPTVAELIPTVLQEMVPLE